MGWESICALVGALTGSISLLWHLVAGLVHLGRHKREHEIMWEAFIKEFRSRRSKKEEMDPPQEYTGELSPEVQRYIRKLASRRDVSLTIL